MHLFRRWHVRRASCIHCSPQSPDLVIPLISCPVQQQGKAKTWTTSQRPTSSNTLWNTPATLSTSIIYWDALGCCQQSAAYCDFSTSIKDAGIAIRHSQEYTLSILQGPEMDSRWWTQLIPTKSKKIVAFESAIAKIKVSKFWMSEKCMDSCRSPTQQAHPVNFNPFWPNNSSPIQKGAGFSAVRRVLL